MMLAGLWLAYTDYKHGKPDLYIRHVKEKRGTFVSFKGSNITPAWVPGQFALAAALSYEGNPALYLLTGKGKIVRKLTRHWNIDISPSWSPDGKALAFVSVGIGFILAAVGIVFAFKGVDTTVNLIKGIFAGM